MIGEDGVRAETVWSCMQCNACVEICPVGIEQAPIINQLRRRLVEEGELDPSLQSTLQTIHKSGNSFGENKRRRGRWTKELDFEVPDARKQPVDVLWFVGDYASFDPRSQQVTQTLARLLHEAGVDFGILYDGERNAGNDVRRVGEEGLFETLAEQNIETLAGCEFNRIVTTDPHSLNTLRNEYPALGGELAGGASHDAAAGAARRRAARARSVRSNIASPTTTRATSDGSTASTTPHDGSSSCSDARSSRCRATATTRSAAAPAAAGSGFPTARSGAPVREPDPRGGLAPRASTISSSRARRT